MNGDGCWGDGIYFLWIWTVWEEEMNFFFEEVREMDGVKMKFDAFFKVICLILEELDSHHL